MHARKTIIGVAAALAAIPAGTALAATIQGGPGPERLVGIGYVHRGDLGVTGREAFFAPDESPRRHVYVCETGTLNVRNHLAVRDTLRVRDDLRGAYAAVKLALAADPRMGISAYIARKSAVVQQVLAASGEFSDEELAAIHRLNDPSA